MISVLHHIASLVMMMKILLLLIMIIIMVMKIRPCPFCKSYSSRLEPCGSKDPPHSIACDDDEDTAAADRVVL